MLQDRSLSPPTSPRPRSQPAAITDRRDATSSLKQHWTARERKPYKLKSIFSRNLTSRFHHRKPTTLPRLDSRIAESPLTSKLTELKMKSKMGAEARAQTRRQGSGVEGETKNNLTDWRTRAPVTARSLTRHGTLEPKPDLYNQTLSSEN